MSNALIPPSERRELRSVVRQQFKVLRTEVKQRETELVAEAERRLMERYRDEDKVVEDLNWRMQEIGREALRKIQDLVKEVGDDLAGGEWVGVPHRLGLPSVRRKSEDREQLRKALIAGIKEQVSQAQLKLDRQEADLLRSLAMESLETPAARAFLDRIPTVGELVPSARLREIESAFLPAGETTP